VLYLYPWGSSILSIPEVAVFRLAGISTLNDFGKYHQSSEVLIQSLLAAALMAVAVWIFYKIARVLLPLEPALLIAAGGGLGSQIWSTASRGLWSHTWMVVLISATLWMLIGKELGEGRVYPLLMATLMGWAYFVRPTASLSIIAISLLVVATWRVQEIAIYHTAGVAWLAALLSFNHWEFGYVGLEPPIYRYNLTFELNDFPARLLGILVSPSRGLLIYCPIVVFIIYPALRHFRSTPSQKLLSMAFVVIIVQLLVLASGPTWWAGHCYGARYCTDLVPWFVLIATLGCSAFRKDCSISALGRRVSIAGGLTLLALSCTLNAPGALAASSNCWNVLPRNVDQYPERLWDWRNPQFTAPLNQLIRGRPTCQSSGITHSPDTSEQMR
jgi:hypothetical protein